jgi:hypothetical protein
LDRLGDIDGDGSADWIVGAYEHFRFYGHQGYAEVRSGRDGKLIRIDFECDRVGVDGCGIGDVNGDRVPDEVIACPRRGWVRLLSGKDGTLIHEIDVTKLRTSRPQTR